MRSACLAVLVCLAACNSSDRDPSQSCTLDVKPGVRVWLTSAATGEPLTGATATLTEGDQVELMKEPGPGQYDGALERKGTYDLEITAPGFQPHTTKGIVVIGDSCHVITREFHVALSLSSAPTEGLLIRFDGEGHTIDRVRFTF